MAKRRSVAETINHLDFEDDDVVFNLIEEISQEELDAAGFRWSAPSTQKQQNRVLSNFQAFVRVISRPKLPADCDEETLDQRCFPLEATKFDEMYRNFRLFLIFIADRTPARSKQHKHITYQTLTKIRVHLMFWTKRIYQSRNQAGADTPNMSRVFNKCTEAIQFAARKRRITARATQTGEFSAISLPEIQGLMDSDLLTTPCVELAEVHHLAWCLGRVCALRPGSLGSQRGSHRDETAVRDYLTFGDVEVTRTNTPGKFDAKLSVRILKTMTLNNPEAITNKAGPGKLVFRIHSPQMTRNLVFSIPHRLLVIGLRRKAIQGVGTLRDLLDGKQRTISWKPEFRNKPILLAGGARGLSVQEDTPCAAEALTEYLARRALNAGYGTGVTFYFLRKGAARVWARLFGEDAAREMMGHAPDSRTLEQFYVELRSSRDVAAAGLGEDVQALEAADAAAESVLALSKLTPETLASTQGHVLNAQYRQMIAADPDKPKFTNSADAKNYERRMRRAALLVVMKSAQEELQATMTTTEYERRTLRLQDVSTFMQRVTKHAQESMRSANETVYRETSVNFDQDFTEEGSTITQQEAEQDAETTVADKNGTASLEPDLEDDEPDADGAEEVSYHTMVEAFMESLLEDQRSQYVPLTDSKQTCMLCASDITVSQDLKQKLYTWKSLQSHMTSKLHSPKDGFWRKREAEAATDLAHNYSCPYCNELKPEGASKPTFSRRVYLSQHLEQSTNESIYSGGRSKLSDWQREDGFAAKHDILKTHDGWYSEEWMGTIKHREDAARQETNRHRRAIEEHIMYIDLHMLLEPVPSTSNGFLQHGHRPQYLQAEYEKNSLNGWLISTSVDSEPFRSVIGTESNVIVHNQDLFAENRSNKELKRYLGECITKHVDSGISRSLTVEDMLDSQEGPNKRKRKSGLSNT